MGDPDQSRGGWNGFDSILVPVSREDVGGSITVFTGGRIAGFALAESPVEWVMQQVAASQLALCADEPQTSWPRQGTPYTSSMSIKKDRNQRRATKSRAGAWLLCFMVAEVT